jgi:hypothetical protein
LSALVGKLADVEEKEGARSDRGLIDVEGVEMILKESGAGVEGNGLSHKAWTAACKEASATASLALVQLTFA